MIHSWRFWALVFALGAATWLMRVSFIALLSRREPPERLLRALRFVPVTVLPALIAPGVVFPAAEGGAPSLTRIFAAVAALAVGAFTRSMLATIATGIAAFAIGRMLM